MFFCLSTAKQNAVTVLKLGWIRRAVAAGTTVIFAALMQHMYCKEKIRTNDHSGKSRHIEEGAVIYPATAGPESTGQTYSDQ